MRKTNEIRAELDAKMKAFESAEGESRAALAKEIATLTDELNEATIAEAAARALANQRVLTAPEIKEIKRFSMSKFLRELYHGGNLTGLEADLEKEGREGFRKAIGKEAEGFFLPNFLLRDLTYSPNASEENYNGFVKEGGMTYIQALRNNMIAAQLGVRYLDGLSGNLAMVQGGAAAASWLSEESAASVVKPTYVKKLMTPKRLQILQGFTYDILHQSGEAIDQILMQDMVQAHAEALDAAVFAGSGSSGAPQGIIGTTGVGSVEHGTNGGNETYAKLVSYETVVGSANGLFGQLAYVTNSKVNGYCKSTPQIAGYPLYLFNDGKTNGYPVFVTNSIPSNGSKGSASGTLSSMIFGNFNEVIVGGWGGLQFIVDPYSEKEKGVIEISAHAYHDVFVRRPACFAVSTDIVTE